ncbi:hypothetical protein V494_00255 [Pseudogymnoascus sp. VKM F-4513 (FW-928)]|nr:hypothetical protein V494_00255 [Pseudogymnoascus sp. VKM F-4513 (FW-928)]
MDNKENPPPPYSVKEALPSIPGQTTPNTSDNGAPSGIPNEHWDLACNIDVDGGFLQLDAAGVPIWKNAVAATSGEYQRDGISVLLNSVAIVVTNQVYTWKCGLNTVAGELLTQRRDNVSLRNLGNRLVVFERTVATRDRSRPPPVPRDDLKGSLKVELQRVDILSSPGTEIWSVTGTDIYQVEGCGNDLVVSLSKYLRLWDMAKGKFRWEKEHHSCDGHIDGFTEKYIVRTVGYVHLHERKNGNVHGHFQLPSHTAYIDLNKDHRFGPVIGDRQVEFRIWESIEVIQGSLVVRGSLDELELELIGQKTSWIKHGRATGPPMYRFAKRANVAVAPLEPNRFRGNSWKRKATAYMMPVMTLHA